MTPEEQAKILADNGFKPWQARIVETDDAIEIHPIQTEDRGALEVGLRRLGARIPRVAAQVAGAAGAVGVAAKPLLAAAKAGTRVAGPYGGLTTGLLASGVAGGLGSMAGDALYQKVGAGPMIDDFVLGSEAQRQRDEAEHPWATRAADFAAQIPSLKLANMRDLAGAALKLGTVRDLVNRTVDLTPAQMEAAVNLVGNVGFGAGGEAIAQLREKRLDLGDIAAAALSAAPFGDARWKKGPRPMPAAAPQSAPPPVNANIPVPRALPETAAPGFMTQPTRLAVPTRQEQLQTTRPNLQLQQKPWRISTPTPPIPVPSPESVLDMLRAEAAAPPPTISLDAQGAAAGGASRPEGPAQRVGAFTQQAEVPSPESVLRTLRDELPPAAPDPAISIQEWLRRKYQGALKASAADAPTPESAETVAAQVAAAADPRSTKKAAFVVAGSELPESVSGLIVGSGRGTRFPGAPPALYREGGLIPVQHRKGVLLYNPSKMTRAEADAAVAGDQIDGRVLGMSQPEKPAGGDVVVATDLPGAPAVQTEVVAGPEQVPAAVQSARRAIPGGTQRLATPEEIEAGRQALRNRGFAFSEAPEPILTPDGSRAAGMFDPATGQIQIDATQTRPTTHVHEGLHAELQNMMLSDNPREVRLAAELIKAARGEEPLVEGGAEAQYVQRGEHPLVRLFKTNWDYFRSTRFGGNDNTPERAAAQLADFFSRRAPRPVRTALGAVKGQPAVGVFSTELEKQARTGRPWGLVPARDGTLDSVQVLAKWSAQNDTEKNLMPGLPAWLAARPKVTAAELADYARSNDPGLAVHAYGMDREQSVAKKELDKLMHEWYDNLDTKSQAIVNRVRPVHTGNPTAEGRAWVDRELSQLSDKNQTTARRYLDLAKQVIDEPYDNARPTATHFYNQVSPASVDRPMPSWTKTKGKRNLQRVDVALPQKLKEGWVKRGVDHYENPTTGDILYGRVAQYDANLQGTIWFQDDLHENMPNTLGWAAIQYEDGPNGERIAHIFEVQSRWGQEKRAYEKAYEGFLEQFRKQGSEEWAQTRAKDEALQQVRQYRPGMDHPLVSEYNRLILKAAIDKAREEGATHISISDADTAMMTEMHDQSAVENMRNMAQVMVRRGEYNTVTDAMNALRSNPKIEQEPGMRFNYDADKGQLHRIARDLTGDEGRDINFGDHKNAVDLPRANYFASYPSRESMLQAAAEHGYGPDDLTITQDASAGHTYWTGTVTRLVPRDNLIFRNPDGTPKTSSTGRLYDITRPAARRFAGEPFSYGGKRYQPIADPNSQEHVPWSVVEQLSRLSKEAGAAVAANAQEKAILRGRIFGVPEAQLAKMPRDVVNSAIQKRQLEFLFRHPQHWTPEELAANAIYDKAMKESAAEATAAGYKISTLDNYVPEPLNTEEARAYQKSGETFIQNWLPRWHDWNSRIYGASYDAADSEAYLRAYMARAAKSPNSQGSDFGALTKSARTYHLPPGLQDTDYLRGMGRYASRWAGQVAYKKTIETNPEAMRVLGFDNTGPHDPRADSEEARNARMAVDDVLFNDGRGTSGLPQGVRDVLLAGQQFAGSAGIGTISAMRNTAQKLPYHAMHAAVMPDGFDNIVEASRKTAAEFEARRQKAIELGFIRPGMDPAGIIEQDAPLRQTARTLLSAGFKLRRYTGAELLENFNRVHDLSIGEGLARLALTTKDADSQQFLRRFGAGVDDTMPLDEQVWRIARNYAEGAQGSYGPTGLPANMLKGGLTGTALRIQRYGIENMMRTYQYAVKPALNGDWRPLFTYLLGAVVTYPVIERISELFTGRPSGLPTEEEIKAGKKTPGLENLLNLMAAAQVVGAFGTAGGVLGAVSNNARGNKQALVGGPAFSFAVDLVSGLAGGAEALRQGEPVLPVVLEVLQRAVVDNIQVLRGLSVDRGEAKDVRNKRVFEYLQERQKVTVPEMALGLMAGNTFSPQPKVSPTMEAAQEGDREAFARLPRSDRRRANNYRGGFEDPEIEGQYRGWLRKTKGPEYLEEYRARRQKFKSRVSGRQPEDTNN